MTRLSRSLAIIAVAFLVAFLLTRLTGVRPRGAHSAPPAPAAAPSFGRDVPSFPVAPLSVSAAALEAGASLNAPDGTPEDDLQALDQLLYFYRQALGENPVGQNEDVTAALLGDNPARARFLQPDHPAVLGGKLVDRWGSPWWFHPLSGRHMEIRGAGPDREMFTPDDIRVPNEALEPDTP